MARSLGDNYHAMNDRPIHFFSAVWGTFFTRQYIDAVLPTFLADGNFGDCRGRQGDRYVIYTTRQDADTIQGSPEYQHLVSLIPTEIRVFDESLTMANGTPLLCWDANKLVNRHYALLIPESIKANAAIMMLTPDQPWSNGSFRKIREILNQGKRAVSLNCMMINAASIVPEMRAKFYNPRTHTMAISSRDLVQLALAHPHEYQTCFDVKAPLFCNFSASTYFWDIPGEGGLLYIIGGDAKAIVHTDPTIPWPEASGFEVLEHVWSLGMTNDNVYWAQESDEIFTIALDSRHFGGKDFSLDPHQLDQPISPMLAAWWVKNHVSKIKQRLLAMPMRMQYRDRTMRWVEAERDAQAYMAQIFRGVEFLDQNPQMNADLGRLAQQIQGFRALQRRSAALLKRVYSTTDSPSDRLLDHEQLVRSYCIDGAIDQAVLHVGAMLDINVDRTITVLREMEHLLRLTSRPELGLQLLHKCEALIHSRGSR